MEAIISGASNSNNGNVTANHGNQDYWLAKLDSTGNLQWQKSLGGTGNDYGSSVIQTADDGYVVAGTSDSNNGNVTANHGLTDGWVLKLNSDAGIIYWQKSFGGTNYDVINQMIPTADGGYIFAGNSSSNNGDVPGNNGYVDYWIVKINSDGNLQWKKSLGGTGDDRATSIVQTSDGGYAVAGYAENNNGDVTGNHDGTDAWIVKLNSDGNIQWQKALGGSKVDEASSIIQTADGGYLVLSSTTSNDGQVIGYHTPSNTGPGEAPLSYDYWAVKLSAIGNIQWQKCLGGSGSDEASSVIQTSDGGYVIAGSSNSNNGDVTGNHGDYDIWVVKLAQDNLATNEVLKDDIKVNIFPNPAKDNMTLKLDYFTPSMEITITDML